MTNSEDHRIDHIKCTTLKLLDISECQWEELMWKEENEQIIKDFLESLATEFLLFYIDQNEKLILSSKIPLGKYVSQKYAFFLKNNSAVSSENYKQEIMFGSFSSTPLSKYKTFFEKVLCPIFSNTSNNKRWPAEIASDIIDHIQEFRKILTYHVGVAKNKTVLVIPEIAKSIGKYNIDEMSRDEIESRIHDVIDAINEMVCDWIPIVKEVLEVTSESILSKIQQGPRSELQFWKNRKENLEFIQEQLSHPFIEKMICALEKTGNDHCSLFRKLLQDVAEALAEANEINESLSAMSNQLKKIEACEFTEIKEDLMETLKIMTSAWISSKYFSVVPSRISVLIQKFCFFLMEKVENYLNPSQLFKGEVLEMKNKVAICIETLNTFLQSYSECQENYKEDYKAYPWIFPDERVFDCFRSFLDRLNKVYEIFEASLLYSSIPDFKILGVSHIPFKKRLGDLSKSFKECYLHFIESAYNPLDLKSDKFLEDYKLFSTKVLELDRKLGTTLFQASFSCVTSEDSYKFMKMVENLLKRSSVNLEFKKQVTSLRRNIYMEILSAKESYDNSLAAFKSDNQIVYKNLPPISANVQWSIDLKEKLSYPMSSLQYIQQNYSDGNDADLILRTYKEMEELLQKFQDEIPSTWDTSLNSVKEKLNEPLFRDYEQHLILNFAPQMIDFVRDIQYLDVMNKTDLLPSAAEEISDSVKSASVAHFFLACTLRWYNELAQHSMDFEIMLIKEDWDKVCQDLRKGLDEKWTKSDLKEYSKKAYDTVKLIYEKIYKARQNVIRVQQFIETWYKSPVFVRETPDSIVNFEFFMTPRMRQQIYDVNETSTSMNRAMEENMQLFECDSKSEKWINYVLYLDSIIETSLKESIQCSLQYLAENTNKFNKKLEPFYKIRMVLDKDIVFDPSFNRNELGSFFALFEAVIQRIYAPASIIKRLANPKIDYSKAINEDTDLNNLKDLVFEHIESGINNILTHSAKYQIYSDLWLQDIDEALTDFVLYGPLPEAVVDEETEAPAIDLSLEIKPPTEEEFKAEIAKFDMLQKKIEEVPGEILIESWLTLDAVSFKESLSTLIKNWSSAYKKKLVELKSEDKLRKEEEEGD